jgi:putative addiction module CopG family antidote
MTMQLPPQVEARIREKVESGLYACADAALETAVELLDDYDRQVQQLRAAIAEGEQGEPIPWAPELMAQLSREADEMFRRGEQPDPDVCP